MDTLRLFTYVDKKTVVVHVFLTNNLKLAARTTANLYAARCDIKVFFKWTKQNLKK